MRCFALCALACATALSVLWSAPVAHAQIPRSRLYGPPVYDPATEEIPDYGALPYHVHRLARTPTPAGLMLGPGAASALHMLTGEPGGANAPRPKHDLGLHKSVRDWWKYHWQGKHGKTAEDFDELDDPDKAAKKKKKRARKAKRKAKKADLQIAPGAVQHVKPTAQSRDAVPVEADRPLSLTMSPDVGPLRSLYEDCWGSNWKARRNWMAGDPCADQWDGVVCSGNRVTELVLNYQNILCEWGNDTAWAASISQLSELKYLDLGNNYIKGEIPESLKQLDQLQVLVLACQGDRRLGQEVAQGIPAWLGDMTELRVIDLSDNSVAGTLPPELGKLSNLQVLKLSKNNIQGPVPEEWGALHNLEVLDISDNNLGGRFPAWEWEPTHLLQLAPMEDALQGALPPRPPLGALPAAVVPGQEGSRPAIGGAAVAGSSDADPTEECSDGEDGIDEAGGSRALASSEDGSSSGLVIPGEGRLMLPEEYMGDGWYWEAAGCRLREVSLANSGMRGGLPSWLWGCAWLSILDMSGNNFEGSMPSEVLYLRGLAHLRLSGNRYTGPILPGLGSLPLLLELDVSINRLKGTLPADLLESRSLRILKAGNNRLSGPVPDALGDMETLFMLDLSYNRFSGGIPLALTRSPSLVHLNLAGNGLVGGVPAELGAMPRLTILALEANPLGGTLPDSLGNATRLQSLTMTRTGLRGTLPPSMGALGELSNLNLAGNSLEGPIPGEWGGMYFLNSLDLSLNQLSGEFNPRLGGMANLKDMKLSHNRLSGALPRQLGRNGFFHSLESLDLAHNMFYGVLPEDLLDTIYYTNADGLPEQRTLKVNVGQNSFWCPLPDWASKVSASCVWLEVHTLAYPEGKDGASVALIGSGFMRSLADGAQCIFGNKKTGVVKTDGVWESSSRVLCPDIPSQGRFKKRKNKFGELEPPREVIVRLGYNDTILTKFGQEYAFPA